MAKTRKHDRAARRKALDRLEREHRSGQRSFAEVWKLFRRRMDHECPGWDSDPGMVASCRLTLRQEFEAARHSGIVVVPGMLRW